MAGTTNDSIYGDEDLHVRTLARALVDRLAVAETEDLYLPHVVICTDRDGAVSTYQGPFANAMAAALAATRDQMELDALDVVDGGEGAITFAIAPMVTPAGVVVTYPPDQVASRVPSRSPI